jgi:UDP-GlcNAc:undecaprenyl-phosphate/decaprenyl-phosphate GlcNAc-1-phosphate transferase
VELIALAVAFVSAIASLVLTPAIRAASIKIGFIDKPGERKIHSRDIAYGGGIAVAAAMALVMLVGLPVVKSYYSFPVKTEDLSMPVLLVLCLGSLGALVLGLIDDKYKLSPRTKLAAQFVLAIAAVACGVRITALIGDTWLMKAVSVLWIVLITNSFNLLDNMDGLCAGTVAIAASVLSMVAIQSGQWTYALALAALAGACMGFLRYNRAPASIFLGDAGSLFVGYLMACFTVLVTYFQYNRSSREGSELSHLAVGIPVLILAIPLYDTLSVIVIRIREGRPIMRGDTSHFSHRLVDLGMSRRQAVTTIHLACIAIGLPATVLGQLSVSSGFLIIGQAVLVLTIVALLEHAGRTRAQALGAKTISAESTAPASAPSEAALAPKQNKVEQNQHG